MNYTAHDRDQTDQLIQVARHVQIMLSHGKIRYGSMELKKLKDPQKLKDPPYKVSVA